MLSEKGAFSGFRKMKIMKDVCQPAQPHMANDLPKL